MSLSSNVTAIIPARSGSKGISNKNIRDLGGYPLIAYSIIASKLSKEINRTIVSTDSPIIAEIARHYGAEVPFLRPKIISSDKSTDKEFVDHAINWFLRNEKKVADYFVHLRPTTPLRDPAVIDQAVANIKKNVRATSLRSAHLASETPWKWFSCYRGYFRDIEGKPPTYILNLPRQSFRQVYIPNGYVDVLKTSFIRENKSLHGDRIIAFVTSKCHEVDTQEELGFLNHEVQQVRNKIFTHLQKHFDNNSGSCFRHVGLVVKNLKRSLIFYTSTLGLKIRSSNIEKGEYIDKLVGIKGVILEWVKLEDKKGGLVELLQYRSPLDIKSFMGLSHLALTVDNIESMYSKLIRNGYECNSKPLLSPDKKVKVLYCRDPDGIYLELVEEICC